MVNHEEFAGNLPAVESSYRIELRIGLLGGASLVKAANRGYILAGFFLLATVLSFGQATPDPWLLLASSNNGAINGHTSREELVRVSGKANVIDGDVEIGE